MKLTAHKALFVLLLMVFSTVLMAKGPNGNCRKWTSVPNLTSDQESKIKNLETIHLNKMLPLRNELNELQARHQTLQTEKAADLTKINDNIDKISKVKGKIAKERARFQQEIRLQLSDDQRLWFDTCTGHHGRMECLGAGCCPKGIVSCKGHGPSQEFKR